MRQTKLWVIAAILVIICGACVITCCNSDEDNPVVSPTDDSNRRYLNITNKSLQGRGLCDTFYKEYSKFIREARSKRL